MTAPNAVRRRSWVEASQQRHDVPRCGVCDQPCSKPLCHKCEAVAALTAERFGDPDTLEDERA